MMIELKPCNRTMRQKWQPVGLKLTAIKRSLPFLESTRGLYAHRIKHVTMQTFNGKSHFIVKVWCGTSFCTGGDGKGQTLFESSPTSGKPVCATCEGRYIGSGQAGDRVINGNPVMYRPFGFNV
ncbi:MAG: hypothetical protein RSE38_16075 [Acinetobacter sp.]